MSDNLSETPRTDAMIALRENSKWPVGIATLCRKLERENNALREGMRQIVDMVGGESDDPDVDIARMQDIALAALKPSPTPAEESRIE